MSDAVAALDMESMFRRAVVPHRLQVGNHCVLSATPEERARAAVDGNFFRQPGMRHDREAHVREIAGLMREHAQLVVTVGLRAAPKLVDDRAADARSTPLLAHHERPDLCERMAEGSQLAARHHRASAVDGHHKSIGVDVELVELARQKAAFLRMLPDQLVNAFDVAANRRSKRRRLSSAFLFFHVVAPANTPLNAASSNTNARSSSASVIVSGGSNRMTFPAVRFTSTPCRMAAS